MSAFRKHNRQHENWLEDPQVTFIIYWGRPVNFCQITLTKGGLCLHFRKKKKEVQSHAGQRQSALAVYNAWEMHQARFSVSFTKTGLNDRHDQEERLGLSILP